MAEGHRIWLVRHGETEWSKSGQHTGRTDIPLTTTGEQQGKALGRHLAGRGSRWCSRARWRGRARPAGWPAIADGAEVTDDLLEWDYGIYEGRKTADVRVEQPGWSIWTTPIPKGETVEQVGERARRVIERADAVEGDVALFAHAHVLRILAACWIGLPPIHGRQPHARHRLDQRARLRAGDARHPGLEPGLALT